MYEYDDAGRVESVTTAFGTADASTTRYIYDLLGQMEQVIDPRAYVTHYEYDAAGYDNTEQGRILSAFYRQLGFEFGIPFAVVVVPQPYVPGIRY